MRGTPGRWTPLPRRIQPDALEVVARSAAVGIRQQVPPIAEAMGTIHGLAVRPEEWKKADAAPARPAPRVRVAYLGARVSLWMSMAPSSMAPTIWTLFPAYPATFF